MGELLVHTEHVTYLTTSNTDVACRNVLVWTDVTIELCHEGLAETHYLSVALAAWREVRTTLGTTHRESGKRVLECLLEGKELQNTEVHRLVETDTTFVGTNDVVVLDTVTHVGMYLTLVVCPCDTEFDNSVGDAKTLNEVRLLELWVLVVLFLDCRKYLTHCLDVLRLIGEPNFEFLYNLCCVHKISFLVVYISKFLCSFFLAVAKLHLFLEKTNKIPKKIIENLLFATFYQFNLTYTLFILQEYAKKGCR